MKPPGHLPRQARDKHEENSTKKKRRFSHHDRSDCGGRGWRDFGLCETKRTFTFNIPPFFAVYIEMRSFYQDRLGTNIGTALKKTTVCNIPCVCPKLVLANKRLSSRYSNTATTKTNGPFFLAPSLCTRALCRLRCRRRTRRHRWRLSFWRRCAKTQRPPGWSWRQWSPSLRPAARRLLRSYRWGRRLPAITDNTHKQDDHSGNVPENKNMQKEGSARPRQSEEKAAADIFYSCVFSTRTCPLSVIRLRHGRAHTRALVQREPPALSVVRQQLTRLPRPRGIVRYRHHVDEHRREVARRREKRTARRRVAVD